MNDSPSVSQKFQSHTLQTMRSLPTSPARWLLLLLMAPSPSPAVALCDCQLTRHDGSTMRCSGCGQEQLPSALGPGVVRLELSGNHLSSLSVPPAAAPALARVTALYVDGNNVRELRQGDTCAFRMLRVLDLSKNELKLVAEQSIACNHHLKRLVLNDNPGLQLEALESRSLTHLFLERCDLSSLDKRLLNGLPALRYLYVRGNPKLHCAKVSWDFKHLHVYCDHGVAADSLKTTTNAAIISSTSATPNSFPPNKSATPNKLDTTADSPSRDVLHKFISLHSPAFLVFIILLVFILAVIFVFLIKSRSGTEVIIGTANGKLLQDPC